MVPVPALPTAGPEEVERALDAVFARPELAPPSRSPMADAVREGLAAAWRALRRLLPDISLGDGSGTIAFWVVMTLLVAAAALIAVRLDPWVSRLRRRNRATSRTAALLTGPPAPHSGPTWDELARSLATKGRWRDAALALYQALLHRLATQGVLRLDPAKTPGDYRREIRGNPASQRVLETFLRSFEPVAFGGRPADAAAYERLRQAAGRSQHGV